MRGGIMHKVVADDSIHYFAVRSNSDEKTLEDHHFRYTKCKVIECTLIFVWFSDKKLNRSSIHMGIYFIHYFPFVMYFEKRYIVIIIKTQHRNVQFCHRNFAEYFYSNN